MALSRQITAISAREFGLVALLFLLIATINALYFAFRIGYFAGYDAGAYGCHVPAHQDYSADIMRLKIEVALVLIVAGLWSRRILGFLISLLATMFVEYQYGLWYLDTQRWLREMQVTDFSQLPVPSEWPNFAGLYRATPWDFALLVFFTALFAWQVRVLIAHVKRPSKTS